MKKIINGKRYDTETAKACGWRTYSTPRDFNHLEETLYRKRSGEFFLHGIGGPMTKYAESLGGNSWSGGEKIIPLTIEEAKEWAEEYLTADEYERIFGAVEEGPDRKTISLSLPVAVVEYIKRGAAEKGVTMSDYVASLIPER